MCKKKEEKLPRERGVFIWSDFKCALSYSSLVDLQWGEENCSTTTVAGRRRMDGERSQVKWEGAWCNENCMIQDGAKINTFHVYHPPMLSPALLLLVLRLDSSIFLAFTCFSFPWKNLLFTPPRCELVWILFSEQHSSERYITLPRNHFLIKFITFWIIRKAGFNSIKLLTLSCSSGLARNPISYEYFGG